MGYGLRAVPLLFALTLILPRLAFADPEPDLSAIQLRAAELELSHHPYWRTLLHYKPSLGGSYKSLVDDPKFFFAQDGKVNPGSELAATLEAFFSPKEEGVLHPTSRFPARYAWLRGKLDLDAGAFPYDGDVEFLALKDALKPDSIQLIFPSGYMKAPASMFGHTFLLIEAEGGNRLLSHSVNYGAITTDTLGPVYAFKGLIGAYRGYYSFLPYYQKIREYGDIDMRDMWEYELAFSEAEIDRFLRHVVEMGEIYSDYYFIGENCSYNILFLIEAARPETRITEAFGFAVEPVETLRVVERLALTGVRVYRPSLYTRIEYLASLLTARENAYVRDLCFGRKAVSDFSFPELDPAGQTALWELSSDYLKFLLSTGKVSEADYRKRLIPILSARRKLGKIDVMAGLKTPEPPHAAHGSSRIDIKAGIDARGPYSEVAYRLTAHEIMDSDAGYTRNSQLVFGSVAGRWHFEDETFTLTKADLIDIVSIPPSDSFFFNPCYEFRTGLASNPSVGNDEILSWRIKAAGGLSVSPFPWVQAYSFAGVDSYFSTGYAYGMDLLFGGELGLLTTAGPWKSRLSATVQQTFFEPVHTRYALSAEERIALGRDFALSATYAWKGDFAVNWQEWGVSLHLFF